MIHTGKMIFIYNRDNIKFIVVIPRNVNDHVSLISNLEQRLLVQPYGVDGKMVSLVFSDNHVLVINVMVY
jgi:hypothetical protein